MAKTIKGITIKLGAETVELQTALKDVEKSSRTTESELRKINSALKFNPENTVLLTQKQEVLSERIENTANKLDILKAAQEEVEKAFADGDIGAEEHRAFQREIETTESKLKTFEGQLESTKSEQADYAQDVKRLETFFQATGTSVDNFSDKLGSKLVKSIKDGKASSDDLKHALSVVGTETLGTDADLEKLKRTLDSIDDGNSIDNVKQDIVELGDASNSTDTKLDKLTKLSESQGLNMVADTLSNVSDKMVSVGLASMESAATAQASKAQYSQVFGDLENEATSALDKISQETSMVPSRLRPAFTQMASFAKTTGMDTAEALSLTERATLAAADSAAFYDKSVEEVTDSLQSFLKGNYENDAALGISATETTRNAKANELYGKSFKDLDEAQKQLTLLAMVEEGNQLSGALGQAAREGDQYENVLRNMKASQEEFLAAVGQPVMEMFVQILEAAIPVVQKLTEWFTNLSPTTKTVIAIIGAIIVVIGALLPVILSLISTLGILSAAGIGVSAAFLPVIATIAAVVAVIGIFIAAGIAIYNNLDTIKQKANELAQGISNAFSNIVSTTQQKWSEVTSKLSNAMNKARDIVRSGVNKLKSIMNFKWSLPKLKLPHFNISGSFSLNPPSVPRFGVEWYKKGGILTKPTAFGMNGHNLMVGGEAGKEAVLPLNDANLSKIGYAITEASNMGQKHETAVFTEILKVLKQFHSEYDPDRPINLDTYDVSKRLYLPINKMIKSEENFQGRMV